MNRWKLAALILGIAGAGSDAATFTSTTNGGIWSNAHTWNEASVPGSGDSVVIDGAVTVTTTVTCCNLTITENAILQGDSAAEPVILTVTGSMINNGTIRNAAGTGELHLEVHGDLFNGGTWRPSETHLPSHNLQTIAQSPQSTFEGNFFFTALDTTPGTFALVAASDLFFHRAVSFNCRKYDTNLTYQGTFDMAGFNLSLSGGTYLTGACFRRTNKVTCLDSSMIGDAVFEDPVFACGNFQIAVQSVYFNNTLTVIDTLENGAGGCCIAQGIMFARGGIINKGVIRNHPEKFELWCTISGNVENAGTWINSLNILTDSAEQTVTLDNGRSIAARFQFDGMWPANPYIWEKNGETLPGDTFRLLWMDSLAAPSAGVYRCKGDSTWSRAITVLWDSSAGLIMPEKTNGRTPPEIIVRATAGQPPQILFVTSGARSCELSIFDFKGRKIAVASAAVAAGTTTLTLPPNNFPAGMYTIRLRSELFEKFLCLPVVR